MLQRRGFLALMAGAGLSLAFDIDANDRANENSNGETVFKPNAYLRIEPDGRIILIAPAPEMGQGVKTSLPMLLAEELDVGMDQVTVEQASIMASGDEGMGWLQSAGGSTSVRKNWLPMRQAGAAARWLIVSAAAQAWNVPRESLRTERGMVIHDGSSKQATYASLAGAAGRLSLPGKVELKDAASFRLIGQRQHQVDSAAIVHGKPLFCGDVRPKNCLVAIVIKAPVFGAKPLSANVATLKSMDGIVDAFILDAIGKLSGDMMKRAGDVWLQASVVIVARNTWSALKARRALQVQWEATPYDGQSSSDYRAEAQRQLGLPGELWRNDGDVESALSSASAKIDAFYELPILSHNTMETMSCLAEPLPNGGLRITSPSQFPTGPVDAIHKVLGIPKEKIELKMPRLGGAFGRRWENDFVLDASAIALRVKAPVLLFTPRDEDMRHDYYRPFEFQRIRAGVDAQGKLIAWDQDRLQNSFHEPRAPTLTDTQFPVNFIPNLRMRARMIVSNLQDGAYRAPPANLHAFFVESAFNELAHAAQMDQLAFRLQLLGEERKLPTAKVTFDPTRMKAVLQLAAAKADWGSPLPKGSGRGIASWFSHAGYVAHVVELSVSRDGNIKVQRVTSAVDVGRIVNLSGAEQQVQGSVIDALSGSLLQQITIKDGAVEQSNFHDNPILRMPDIPSRIEVHFVDSMRDPTGLGEPAYPPIAPALVDALFVATGKRIRSLPVSQHNLAWGQ